MPVANLTFQSFVFSLLIPSFLHSFICVYLMFICYIQAPKRKFVLNSSAQSETSGAYKTPKMDDEDSSATASASSSQEASLGISSSDFESPSKKNKLQFTEHGSETADAELQNIDSRLEMRSPLMSKPLTDYEESEKVAPGEQYIPLVQLMVPPPSAPPPRPPPPSSAPKKVAKGSKSKNCYHQLAESVAAELATVNERLHQKLRSSFEKLQSNEQLCNGVQALEEVEEDTYVLVNQRGESLLHFGFLCSTVHLSNC